MWVINISRLNAWKIPFDTKDMEPKNWKWQIALGQQHNNNNKEQQQSKDDRKNDSTKCVKSKQQFWS